MPERIDEAVGYPLPPMCVYGGAVQATGEQPSPGSDEAGARRDDDQSGQRADRLAEVGSR